MSRFRIQNIPHIVIVRYSSGRTEEHKYKSGQEALNAAAKFEKFPTVTSALVQRENRS